jgi:hypothetical protein
MKFVEAHVKNADSEAPKAEYLWIEPRKLHF